MTDLTATLTELDTWLQEFAPDVLEELAEPASAELLAKLTESYSAPIPEDVLAVYAWHDGGEIPDPWWELSRIDEVLRAKELHESMPDLRSPENWWSNAWIPIGTDLDGNHLCVDLDGCFGGIPGQLLVFMHDESMRNIVAPSLGAYMEAMLKACRDGVLVYDQDEGFATDENQSAWQEFLSANLSGTMQQP